MSISHITSIKPNQATGQIKEIYNQLKSEMGDVVEPISLHALQPNLLKGIWGILRETVLVEDEMTRVYKECIGAAVSSSNECPYCVDAHTIMIIGLKDKVAAKAIVSKNTTLIEDKTLKGLVDWSFKTRFFKSQSIQAPKFSEAQGPEAIGTAVFFHYLNRMVTIFLGPTILPMNISFLKEPMKKMAAAMFSKVLATKKEAGNIDIANVDLIDSEELYWTKSNPRIETAFKYFDTVTHQLGLEYVPEEIRTFLTTEISEWDGSNLKSTKELEEKLLTLPEKNRPLAKILYLTCLSPHRIHAKHFNDCKSCFGGSDDIIIACFCWASFLAAKRIGSQLGVVHKDSLVNS